MDNARRGLDFIGISVVSLLHDGNGNFLLQKRGPKARDERGHWDLCAGALEYGDTIEATINRELMEELNAKPLKIQFLGAGEAHRRHEGQPTHWIWLLHAVEVNPKDLSIKEPHKIAEIAWFTTAALPAPAHSQLLPSLELAKQQRIIK